MPSFSESLKQERESRRATVEDVAAATGIDLAYLEALERNDVGALPGRAFGMLYIRAYAEMLGFDPRPLIEEYERENPRSSGLEAPSPSSAEPRRVRAAIAAWREEKQAKVPVRVEAPEPGTEKESNASPSEPAPVAVEPPVRVEPEPAAPAFAVESPRSGRGLLVAGLAGAAIVIAAGAWVFLRFGEDEIEPPPPARVTENRPPAPEPEIVPRPLPPPDVKPTPPPAPARPASSLRVVESAVGRSRKVETSVDRFAPGELAWFSTRVLGGRPGDRIRHVWIRDGKTIWSKDLGIGAADWRTQTSKRLTHPGAWTVEARDASGAVLASASFVCAP
jgi:cytoskeleton protein RodZ